MAKGHNSFDYYTRLTTSIDGILESSRRNICACSDHIVDETSKGNQIQSRKNMIRTHGLRKIYLSIAKVTVRPLERRPPSGRSAMMAVEIKAVVAY